jgi:TPP-dependent pyruvate/acetoin dehydrogenase alpha subunit
MIHTEGGNNFDRMLKNALRIRLVEERIISLYSSDLIQSPVHLSIGQEMVAVGICEALRDTDLLFSTYRTHAFYLAKGGDMNEMFAELFGRIGGVCQGKAGSMHLAAPAVGLMGASAVVASNLPHAAGAAMAARMRGLDQIAICVFGDGATEEGVYHETLNFIALHELPVLLVCENNGLAVHTALEERQSYSIADQARLYGIPVTVLENGHDMELTAKTTTDLVDKMRAESRAPAFIEIHTSRYKEHVGVNDDFDAGYRAEDDIEKWRQLDPILNNKKLVDEFTPKLLEEIDLACDFANNSPFPNEDILLQDVI